jgi:hypothetical protein
MDCALRVYACAYITRTNQPAANLSAAGTTGHIALNTRHHASFVMGKGLCAQPLYSLSGKYL